MCSSVLARFKNESSDGKEGLILCVMSREE
jgi:hypothetical protein